MNTVRASRRAAAADSLQPRVVPIPCRATGDRNAGGEIVDAENTRGVAPAVHAGAEPAGDWRQRAAEHGRGEHVSEPGPAGRAGLAPAGRARRRAAGGDAVSAAP